MPVLGTSILMLQIMLGLVSSLPQPEPEPGTNINVNINVKQNHARKEDLMDVFPPVPGSPPVPARPVPCDENGGQIQSETCCPWYSSNPDLCTQYNVCVCNDGFEGEACEHDCSFDMCPMNYDPVCGATTKPGDEITFGNKCQFLVSKCNKDFDGLYFLYDGPCMNSTICPRIICPMDVAVVYNDDPEIPGCKICEADPDAPCY